MKLLTLRSDRYRSIRRQKIHLTDFSAFIGANGSGKSTVLDALRFLSEAMRSGDFQAPVFSRGGISHLAWKGGEAKRIELSIRLIEVGKGFEWLVRLVGTGHGFRVEEHLDELRPETRPVRLLNASGGDGWWRSRGLGKVALKQAPTTCALAAAAADANFPGRDIAEFVRRWAFLGSDSCVPRDSWTGLESSKLDPYGKGLSATLHALNRSSPETLQRIVDATRAILGLPHKLVPRESGGHFYFEHQVPGLRSSVHQMASSSGMLRVLALITALYCEAGAGLIGIEEPEHRVHPTALPALVDHLLGELDRVQVLVTTHSPRLLDLLNEPEAVRVVRYDSRLGTTVKQPDDPVGVRRALAASGFGLGEFYETKGFGW